VLIERYSINYGSIIEMVVPEENSTVLPNQLVDFMKDHLIIVEENIVCVENNPLE